MPYRSVLPPTSSESRKTDIFLFLVKCSVPTHPLDVRRLPAPLQCARNRNLVYRGAVHPEPGSRGLLFTRKKLDAFLNHKPQPLASPSRLQGVPTARQRRRGRGMVLWRPARGRRPDGDGDSEAAMQKQARQRKTRRRSMGTAPGASIQLRCRTLNCAVQIGDCQTAYTAGPTKSMADRGKRKR
jgi:hypothetical protein